MEEVDACPRLENYEPTEVLFSSRRSLVYRAMRTVAESKKPVPCIVKWLRVPYPSRSELTRFQLQYELCAFLASRCSCVVKPVCLEKLHNSLVMVFEDTGSQSLRSWARATPKPTLELRLQTAIKIAQALAEIHSQNVGACSLAACLPQHRSRECVRVAARSGGAQGYHPQQHRDQQRGRTAYHRLWHLGAAAARSTQRYLFQC